MGSMVLIGVIMALHMVSGIVWYLANLPASQVGPWWEWPA